MAQAADCQLDHDNLKVNCFCNMNKSIMTEMMTIKDTKK